MLEAITSRLEAIVTRLDRGETTRLEEWLTVGKTPRSTNPVLKAGHVHATGLSPDLSRLSMINSYHQSEAFEEQSANMFAALFCPVRLFEDKPEHAHHPHYLDRSLALACFGE